MPGELGILNVGAGDTKLTFDPKNPAETERASRIVKDMIRRGFALMIEVGQNDKGPIYQRAHDFDESTAEYIIMGGPSDQEIEQEIANVEEPSGAPRQGRKASPRRTSKRIPASSTNAVAVARVAGG